MQFFVQIGLKTEAGDCPPLNINAMRAISVKSYLKKDHGHLGSVVCPWQTFYETS